MSPPRESKVVGRAAQIAPPNRFEHVRQEDDHEQLAEDDELRATRRVVATQFLPDESVRIITENDSPDVGFRYSINIYRGCEHGCAYCYARPTHEWLGLNAGIDFETRILVKQRAPELLRAELAAPGWSGQTIAMSANTDCYQPAERDFRLTRACLEVMSEARQPVAIITKNRLVTRDLDLLQPMAAAGHVKVSLSITTLDGALARHLEPRTAHPRARLEAIAALREAGVPVQVMVAPVIPGLNDREIPGILRAAADAGAQSASYVLLRLPLSVAPVFRDWLANNRPLEQPRIEAMIRSTRAGKLSDAKFGRRMRGTGAYAEQIRRTFEVFAGRYGLNRPLPELDRSQFRPPRSATGQMHLF